MADDTTNLTNFQFCHPPSILLPTIHVHLCESTNSIPASHVCIMFPNWDRPRQLTELPVCIDFPSLWFANIFLKFFFAVPGKFFFGKNCKAATPEQEKEPRRWDIVHIDHHQMFDIGHVQILPY